MNNNDKKIIEDDLLMMEDDIAILLKFYADNKSREEANEIFGRLARRVKDIKVRLELEF